MALGVCHPFIAAVVRKDAGAAAAAAAAPPAAAAAGPYGAGAHTAHGGAHVVCLSLSVCVCVAAKSTAHGSRHWSVERGLAVGSLLLVPAAVFVPSAPVDYAMGVVFPLHAYYGLEARASPSHVLVLPPTHRSRLTRACAQSAVIDYLPKRKVGAVYTVALNGARLVTLLAMYGLYELNANDIGITNAVKALWTI
jgi:hypothetical protein